MPTPEIPSSSKNPLRGAVEIIPSRLYFCALNDKDSLHNQKLLIRNPHNCTANPNQKFPLICFNVDDELVYWNFFLDFGPLNLGQLWRFTNKLNKLLALAEKDGAMVLFYSSTVDSKRANAIFLICAWQILEMHRSPEAAMFGFSAYSLNPNKTPEVGTNTKSNRSVPPLLPLSAIGAQTIERLPPFHDASPYKCSYHLTLRDCLAALVKARQFQFFDWGEKFDVKEYEHFEQVENGDLNWIVKGKILAFAGPSYVKTVSPEGYCTLSPNDYIPYFNGKQIGLVVRLNQKNYNEKDFIDAGIDHFEEIYTDGSCPNMDILQRVVAAFERVPRTKGFAVHCKAGLGRTGTCIGAYLMKHYRMTAKEVIGWMRICRPGMVIGPQQQFLENIQPIMWHQGDMMRSHVSHSFVSRPLLEPKHRHSTKLRSTTTLSPASRSTGTFATGPESSASMIISNECGDELGHEVVLGGNDNVYEREKHEGRPGQADGLLAARQSQNRTNVTPQSPSVSRNTNEDVKSNDKSTAAVPVTPDTRASSTNSSSSSVWARAFG